MCLHLQNQYQQSTGLTSTPTALLRMQFGMEGQESTSSTQEVEKTESASLPAYTPNYKALKTAVAHIEVSAHASHSVVLIQMPCPSCRPSSQTRTLTITTCRPSSQTRTLTITACRPFSQTRTLGAGIAQLVVFGLTIHSVAGSILLWGNFPVQGIFPLELTWVQTPFPQKLLRMRV